MSHHLAATVAALSLFSVLPGATAASGAGTLPEQPSPGRVSLVSVGPGGRPSDGHSGTNGTSPVSSADGRWVVFSTTAALVPQDTNDLDDVYLRDTSLGRTRLVSTTAAGAPGDGASYEPTLSGDGRMVAFTTEARNLVPGHRGDDSDVVARDLRSGAYQLVSQTTTGHRRPGSSFSAVMSGDGRHVAVQTFARLTDSDTDAFEDVYVRDLTRRTTTKASYLPDGRDVRSFLLVGGISWHGDVVTFGDDQHAWARHMGARRTQLVWHEEPADPTFPAGTVGRPAVSGNGRYVAFGSAAVGGLGETDGRSNIYRRDLRTGRLERVTRGRGGAPDGDSYLPSLSRSGRFIGLGTTAGNLVAGDGVRGDSEAVVVDQRTHRTTWASPSPVSPTGESARSDVAISANGRALVYPSYDEQLTPEDHNGWDDVFVWKR